MYYIRLYWIVSINKMLENIEVTYSSKIYKGSLDGEGQI